MPFSMTGFSADTLNMQEDKIYVQTLIKEDSDLIKDWVVRRSGNIYISGYACDRSN